MFDVPPTGACATAIVAALVTIVPGPPAAGSGNAPADASARPTLALRATPPAGLTPLRVHFVGEVRGGPDDNEDLYCPTVVWDWGDDTVSESQADCEPFQPGKSRIRRFYSIEHLFRVGGFYRVRLTLRQGRRSVLSASVELSLGHAGPAAASGPLAGAPRAAAWPSATRLATLN